MKTHIYGLMLILFINLFAISCGKNAVSIEETGTPVPGEMSEEDPIPVDIEQVSPNPFHTTVLVKFRVNKKLYINLRFLGDDVRIILLDEVREAGVHYLIFDAPSWLRTGRYRFLIEEVGRGRIDMMAVDFERKGSR
jgi:hypothetical protein